MSKENLNYSPELHLVSRRENLVGNNEILDMLPDPVCVFDKNGHIISSSSLFNKTFSSQSLNINLSKDYINSFSIENFRQEREELLLINNSEKYFKWHDKANFDLNGNLSSIYSVAYDYTSCHQEMKRLEIMSTTDELTGLYNRNYLEAELKRLDLLVKDMRSSQYSIIFCDINGLKSINDSYSHKDGDELIKRAASSLVESCRESDIIARIGGDEFIIVLPQTDMAEANNIVSRIHKTAEKNNVSIALGAAYRHNEEDFSALKHRADKAMYICKKRTKRDNPNWSLGNLPE